MLTTLTFEQVQMLHARMLPGDSVQILRGKPPLLIGHVIGPGGEAKLDKVLRHSDGKLGRP